MNNTQSLLPRLLPTATAAGAAALLALVAFNTFNAYFASQDSTQEDGAILRSRTTPQAPANSTNLKQIPGWHLFGDNSRQAQAPTKKEIIEAPTTPLALTLQGTFLGTSSTGESWAIISSSNNAQAMYKAGDEIPGGATLFAVEPFRVILERNGRHESLALPRPSMDENQLASVAEPPRKNLNPDTAPGRTQQTDHPPPVNRYTEEQALIDEMARIRKKFTQ